MSTRHDVDELSVRGPTCFQVGEGLEVREKLSCEDAIIYHKLLFLSDTHCHPSNEEVRRGSLAVDTVDV